MKLTPIAKAWITRRKKALKRHLAAKLSHVTRKANKKQVEHDNKDGFETWNGKYKEKVRDLIVKLISSSPVKVGTILSLEASNFKRAKQTYECGAKGYDTLTCENDKAVFDKLVNNIKNDKKASKYMKKPYYGKIADKIREAVRKKIEYAHVLLDYCGNYSTFRNEILLALRHKIVEVDGYFFLTVLKQREDEKKTYGIPLIERIEKDILRRYVYGANACFAEVASGEYQDIPGSTMYWLILQRKK